MAISRLLDRTERQLEAERGQLPLWAVAAVVGGIAAWFGLGGPQGWWGFALASAGLSVAGVLLPGTRLGRALLWGGVLAATGMGWIAWRADRVAAPRLERPVVVTFEARVEAVEERAARDDVRLTLAPDAGAGLVPRLRVSVRAADAPLTLRPGATVRLRARLTPPPRMAVPGSHDFARDAWFLGIGGVGRALGPVDIRDDGGAGGLDDWRRRLSRHVIDRLPGPAGGIAVALVTGDQQAVAKVDAEAMRRSGLAHLLSVSGLHIAAVVGAAMLLSLKLLALNERLALRFNLVLVAAAGGAMAGIAYTLLTGLQVPTVRSCIAAVLVLAGIALGRDALSLRLVAVGALAVLAVRPEALAGASFQMSFLAVLAIVALHGMPAVQRHLSVRDEGRGAGLLRSAASLLLTGLVVELVLMPVALFHFHKAGLYGVVANMLAIPATTFLVMPLLALALVGDAAGLGAPVWWLAGQVIDAILALAHGVAAAPGAVTMLPAVPKSAYAAMIGGLLWVLLWRRRWRWWGLVPVMVGAGVAAAAPRPDLLVSDDGRHLAVAQDDDRPLLLRDRSGDFVRSTFAEAMGFDGETGDLSQWPGARCGPDSCLAILEKDRRRYVLLATRSSARIDWSRLVEACRSADIVVSDRRLPVACAPRWLKLDRATLAQTGGLAITLGKAATIDSVAAEVGHHPWAAPTAQ